ncbi:MAG TPA: helix-turn-helix domain-containing protein, partial [Leifsonia sp.]
MAGGAGDERSVAARVFAVADAFENGDELTLSEVARRAGLPVSTTHRLLAEWVGWGGLVRGDDGRYRVGIKLWR